MRERGGPEQQNDEHERRMCDPPVRAQRRDDAECGDHGTRPLSRPRPARHGDERGDEQEAHRDGLDSAEPDLRALVDCRAIGCV